MARRIGLVALAFAAACSGDPGPPLRLVLAHSGNGQRCAPTEGTPTDLAITAQGITRVRLSVRAYRPGAVEGELRCDRVLEVPREQPRLKIPLGPGERIELHAEAFRPIGSSDWERVASGSVALTPEETKIEPLRLFPSEGFACVDDRLRRARAFHSALLLQNGQVLVVGGLVAGPAVQDELISSPPLLYLTGDAEVYDPPSGRFFPVEEPAPPEGRAFHHATTLSAGAGCPAGSLGVLLVGGAGTAAADQPAMGLRVGLGRSRLVPLDNQFPPEPLSTRVLGPEVLCYDPLTRTASRHAYDDGGALPRSSFAAAAALPDGVVIAGGVSYDPSTQNSEVPIAAVGAVRGTEVRQGALSSGSLGGSLTVIDGGAALLWGGGASSTALLGEQLQGLAPGAAFTHNPITLAGPAAQTQFHTATLFSDGAAPPRILVAGGFLVEMNGEATQPPLAGGALTVLEAAGSSITATAISPATGGAYSVDDSLCAAADRYRPAGWQSAVALERGRVLLTGGAPTFRFGGCNDCEDGSSGLLCALRQASIFRAPGMLGRAAEGLLLPRFGHSSTRLDDGSVLILGGIGQLPSPADGLTLEARVLPDAEVYNPRAARPEDPGAAIDPDDPLARDLERSGLIRRPGEHATTNPGGAPARACPVL